jgi:hypothetical protein
MNTNSAQFKKNVFNYILSSIDGEGYGIDPNTDSEKVNFVLATFQSEYAHGIKYYQSEQRAFSEWLAGLPSCMNIEYRNYFILELAKEWGSIPADATEKQEDKILNNWFNFISVNFFQLASKLEGKDNLPANYQTQTQTV